MFREIFGLRSTPPEEEKKPNGYSREDIMRNFLDKTVPIIMGDIRNGEPVTLYHISHQYPKNDNLKLKDKNESYFFASGIATRLWESGIEQVRPSRLVLTYEKDDDTFVVSELDGIDETTYSGTHNIFVDDYRRIGKDYDTEPVKSFIDGHRGLFQKMYVEALSAFYVYPSPRPKSASIFRDLNYFHIMDLRRMLRPKGTKRPHIPKSSGLPEKYSGIIRRADMILQFAEENRLWDEDMEEAFDSVATDAYLFNESDALEAHRKRYGFPEEWDKRWERSRELRRELYRERE